MTSMEAKMIGDIDRELKHKKKVKSKPKPRK